MLTLGKQVIAVNLSEQNSKTNHANVEFNSYFTQEQIYSKRYQMKETANVSLKIKVKNSGYLKNVVVTISNANFQIDTKHLNHEMIQQATQNQIKLKQINSGKEQVIEIPVVLKEEEQIEKDFLEKVAQISMTGTYVDGKGKEKTIEKTISNQLIWEAKGQLELTSEVTKFIPYHQENEKGVLVQTVIRSNLKEDILPISKLELTMQVPTIKGIKPKRVNLITNETTSTNGNQATGTYEYDEIAGSLKIQTENQEVQGKIYWSKQGKDEYVVNFIYVGDEVYQEALQNGLQAQMQVKGKVEIPNSQKATIENNTKVNYEEKQTKGSLTEVSIKAQEKLSKGYLYANTPSEKQETSKQTPYEVNYLVQVNDIQLAKQIELQVVEEQYQTPEGNSFKIGEGSYFKQMQIAKNNFEAILGEEGWIEIFNQEGISLGKINKETKQDEKENYVLELNQNNFKDIVIKTSKPIEIGNLKITAEKALIRKQKDTQEQLKQYSKIMLKAILKTEEEKTQAQTEIQLVEPTSKAEISIEENKTLSTVVENKEVGIRVVLDTSSLANSLYKNPTLKIVLPEAITKVDIQKASLIMDNGLTIQNVKVVTENKRPVIVVELKGTQTQYTIDAKYQGTILVLNTNLTVNTLTPSKTDNITLTYTNENEPDKNFRKTVNAPVEFVAPTGVVTANAMTGYAKNSKEVMSISAKEAVAKLETYTDKKIATVTGKVINNYENPITEVVILGRLPSKDNQKIDEEENLGSTFTANLIEELVVTGISKENYTIYYSEKADANQDLQDASNGWTKQASTNTKSYLIVTNAYEMKQGQEIDFHYDIEIPANLSYNNSSYEMYKVYYQNVSKVGTMPETKISPVIQATTGEGPELEVTLQKAVEGNVREGQIVRMTATVKNIGGLKAENAVLKITAPEGTKHTQIKEGTLTYSETSEKERSISLGTLEPGEIITKDYELKIEKAKKITIVTEEGQTISQEENQYPGDKQIQNVVRVTADNIQNEVKSEVCTFTVLEGNLRIENIATVGENEILQQGQKIGYKIKVENISNLKNFNQVVLKVALPQGIKLEDAYYGEKNSLAEKNREGITIEGNNISISLGKLDSLNAYMNQIQGENQNGPQIVKLRTNVYVYLDCRVESITGEYSILAKATAEGIEEHTANLVKNRVEKVTLTIEQKALENLYIKEGKTTTYHFVVKNTGKISSVENKFEMTLPEGLKFVKASYTYAGKTTTKEIANSKTVTITVNELKPNQTLEVAVEAKADLLADQNDKQVVTQATIEARGLSKVTSNQVTTVIEYDAQMHQKPGGNKPTTPVINDYKITGTAWLDQNKDGKREENETLLSGITAVLLNKKDNTIVKDRITNQEKRVVTTSQGTYEFTRVPAGEYYVLFLYDASKYSIAPYQVEGVAGSINSDAIAMTLVFDGERRVAGITDALQIENSNIRDIDLGLYPQEKFDLRIDKAITKITRTTPTAGTDVFTYQDTKLAKIEVLGKNVNKSNIVVEYKIVVTNEGQVPGYARKIVDYLPEDAKFNAEINKDWYLDNSRQGVYNTSLADMVLEPGQSKEVSLILSFAITDKNIGNTINNNAEIYESYNEQGILDIDSVPGNKATYEDDISSADIILSVVTGGQIVIYSSLILAIVLLLGIGIFEINRRVLKKKEN